MVWQAQHQARRDKTGAAIVSLLTAQQMAVTLTLPHLKYILTTKSCKDRIHKTELRFVLSACRRGGEPGDPDHQGGDAAGGGRLPRSAAPGRLPPRGQPNLPISIARHAC